MPPSAAQVAQAQAAANRSLVSVILDTAWYVLKEFIGINGAINCFGGDLWACASLIIGAIPWGKITKIRSVKRAIDRTIAAVQAWRAAKRAAETVLAAARAAEQAALNAKKLAIERAKRAAQAARKKAADAANTTSNKAVNTTKKTGNPAQKDAQANANPKGSTAANSGNGSKSSSGGSKPGGTTGGTSRNNAGTTGSSGAGKTNDGAGNTGDSCPLRNSFTPGTPVLMADGSTKPIEDVKPGDKVVATDPETGDTEVETVTAVIKGDGVKHLVTVVIDTDGPHGSETAEVTATDGHPFWVPKLHEWIDATNLQPGQWLQTSAGTHVQITAIQHWTPSRATVHNLTTTNTHTYYVLAGRTPILAHNCGGDSGSGSAGSGSNDGIDHVALGRYDKSSGIGNGGLGAFAAKVGARRISGTPDYPWEEQVKDAVAGVVSGTTRISFMLDGLPGAGGGVESAVRSAKTAFERYGRAGIMHTQWELLQVADAGLLEKVEFYRWNRRVNDWVRVGV